MNRFAGYLLMTVAIGHALVGLILYRGSLGAICAAGFFNTIRPGVDFDRQAAFWFLTFSPLVFLLGQIANRALDRRDASVLSLIGWYLVGLGVVGAAVLPISGNWTLVAVGAVVLRAARQARTRRAMLSIALGIGLLHTLGGRAVLRSA